uniref:Uncharacterized protein n=1 Tax=uncultured Poseidoniia archaeon TaxID=1697135 RepID=A0A1B1TBD8_9ARCH|nr:hypothetical protein [uncultured Candidatus Thalassoarchaea sp.]
MQSICGMTEIIDPIMTRTSNRPLSTGKIEDINALLFGILMAY